MIVEVPSWLYFCVISRDSSFWSWGPGGSRAELKSRSLCSRKCVWGSRSPWWLLRFELWIYESASVRYRFQSSIPKYFCDWSPIWSCIFSSLLVFALYPFFLIQQHIIFRLDIGDLIFKRYELMFFIPQLIKLLLQWWNHRIFLDWLQLITSGHLFFEFIIR